MTIVISYRPEDDRLDLGQRVVDQFAGRFGSSSLILGTSNLFTPGNDAVRAIDTGIQSADMLVVLIGNRWLGQWLENDHDPDLLAIESALRQNRPIVPILLGDARMPARVNLREAMADFADLPPVTVADATLSDDMARYFETRGEAVPPPTNLVADEVTPAPVLPSAALTTPIITGLMPPIPPAPEPYTPPQPASDYKPPVK